MRAKINYKSHEFKEGISILDALRSLNIEIPTLCYDDRLKPCGGCRGCLVEEAGKPHLITACNTELADGMVIETHSLELEQTRRTLLKEIVEHYPLDVVRRFPKKAFHCWLLHYGLENDCLGAHKSDLLDQSHPYIHVDMSQCITCYRCVRICEELQGQFVWRESRSQYPNRS